MNLMLSYPIFEIPSFFLFLWQSLHLCLFPCLCIVCSAYCSGSAVRQTAIQLENWLGPCVRLQRSKPPTSAVAVWFVPSDCSLNRSSVSVSCCYRPLVFLRDMSCNLQVIFVFTWLGVSWVCWIIIYILLHVNIISGYHRMWVSYSVLCAESVMISSATRWCQCSTQDRSDAGQKQLWRSPIHKKMETTVGAQGGSGPRHLMYI